MSEKERKLRTNIKSYTLLILLWTGNKSDPKYHKLHKKLKQLKKDLREFE